jgi:hypothetical protein
MMLNGESSVVETNILIFLEEIKILIFKIILKGMKDG